MGVYIYRLSTKSRKIVINGVKEDVYPLVYSHKLSYSGGWDKSRAEALLDARRARLENVWARRAAPKYVVWGGDFGDKYNVYTNWPEGQVERDDAGANLDLIMAGRIRRDEKGKLSFEPWTYQDYPHVSIDTALHEQMLGLLKGEWYVQSHRQNGFMRIYTNEPDNFVQTKLLFG